MSRPRKPFGANHPGRLPATMMKVLAAEMTDPSRLRRGKSYAKDGSVLDIIIEPGAVTCEIQGSRSTPYIASILVRPGDGMPLRRDISTECTCPDDDNWDGYACKHIVATMFTLSDEFLLEPELLDLWRNRSAVGPDEESEIRVADVGTRTAGRHLRLVGSEDRDDTGATVAPDPIPTDPLADLLRSPGATQLPEVPQLERIEPELPRSRDLAAVLGDAIANLRIEWE